MYQQKCELVTESYCQLPVVDEFHFYSCALFTGVTFAKAIVELCPPTYEVTLLTLMYDIFSF